MAHYLHQLLVVVQKKVQNLASKLKKKMHAFKCAIWDEFSEQHQHKKSPY